MSRKIALTLAMRIAVLEKQMVTVKAQIDSLMKPAGVTRNASIEKKLQKLIDVLK